MPRFLAIPFAALVLLPAVPAGELPIAPAPRAVATRPVAPFPHVPGEDDLLIADIERLLPIIEVERIPEKGSGAPDYKDPIGLPALPTLPDVKLPPGLDVPPPPAGVSSPPAAATSFAGRTGATKTKLLREGGGNAESERAVALGLAWLARQQKQDGGWEYDAGMKESRVAATGMALLPFLAAGETHKPSKGVETKYQKTVTGGLNYLMKLCAPAGPNAGRMSTSMYEQAIATIPLCEAYGMTKDPALKVHAQAAINYIQRAQGANGSWGYTAGSNGDTSIVGWQVQALQAAKQSKDLVVDDRVIKKAVKFLDFAAAGPRRSMYGYADNAGATAGTALTAVGLMCRHNIDAWGPKHPGMVDGLAGLMNHPPKTGGVSEMYYYYYATQVVHFYEGEDWKNWNEGPKQNDGTRKGGMRDWLVGEQVKKDGADSGSWAPEKGWFGTSCGRLGTTAVSLLTLEVYYRYPRTDDKGVERNAEPKK